jgi:hypothetical protein
MLKPEFNAVSGGFRKRPDSVLPVAFLRVHPRVQLTTAKPFLIDHQVYVLVNKKRICFLNQVNNYFYF